jgi:hypothetical protein
MRPLLVTASPLDGDQNANDHCLRFYENIFLCKTWTISDLFTVIEPI